MSFNTNTDIWFAGAFAAFTVDLLVYPLDTLKTRIQSPNYQTLYKTIPPPPPPLPPPPPVSPPPPSYPATRTSTPPSSAVSTKESAPSSS
ncbi:hypothetical protein GJ744_001390 [Endocarpon pusillum]|uniref:Uncharacterized protein n=1 Tax=Endocarpon pusillum TaxID=364733 RepID=A0A8H7E8L1_9EURO|nr:hypothetical protein GJ744_001390 [Endocarpon pusillum]